MVVNIEALLNKIVWVFGFLFLFSLAFDTNAQMNSTNVIQLDTDEFYIKLNSTIEKIILDVREEKDFKKERIPLAISAYNQEVLLKLTDTLNHEIPLFIYCEFISRSIEASNLLTEKGFAEIYILEEGFMGWKKKKLPVDKNRNPTNKN
ncbi:MAG: rhodanese-like domain-containing protein [Bacteroidales bacterium]|nr:rhodanese-like domain-containing protein [Bacteroidales bacterium]